MNHASRSWRRTGVALAALTASALVLAGCSAPEASGPEKVTFSYLWSGAESKAIEAIIADFNDSQDEVEVTGISSPDFQKQLTSLSASQGSFDISDHFGNAVGSWASKGIIAPLDDLLKANGVDPAEFAPASIEQLSFDGQIYSLPIAVHTFQLLYNKTLLDEAGVEVPTTLEEFEAAIAATTKVAADGTITQLGLGDPSPSTTITTLGYAFGGSWDTGGAPSPTEDGNVQALQWYYDNVVAPVGASKLAEFKSGLGEYMSPEDPFYTGKYAFVIDGEWRAVNIPNTAPDLDWGVVSIPAVSDALAESTQLTVSTLFIPANSQHKEAAAKFLAYLVSDEGATAFSLALGNLPAKLSLVDSSAYDNIPQFSTWLTALASDNVFALSSAPYSSEYSTDLGLAFEEVLAGTSTPEAALQKVADNASNYATE